MEMPHHGCCIQSVCRPNPSQLPHASELRGALCGHIDRPGGHPWSKSYIITKAIPTHQLLFFQHSNLFASTSRPTTFSKRVQTEREQPKVARPSNKPC